LRIYRSRSLLLGTFGRLIRCLVTTNQAYVVNETGFSLVDDVPHSSNLTSLTTVYRP
jgi:hypothetical protein